MDLHTVLGLFPLNPLGSSRSIFNFPLNPLGSSRPFSTQPFSPTSRPNPSQTLYALPLPGLTLHTQFWVLLSTKPFADNCMHNPWHTVLCSVIHLALHEVVGLTIDTVLSFLIQSTWSSCNHFLLLSHHGHSYIKRWTHSQVTLTQWKFTGLQCHPFSWYTRMLQGFCSSRVSTQNMSLFPILIYGWVLIEESMSLW